MRILAIEHELDVPAYANLPEILREEARTVWKLQKDDVIRDIWFTASDHRAILMLECADAAAAREFLEDLPLVRRGYIDFTVLELRSYDGFERLFSAERVPHPGRAEEPPEY